MSADECIRPLMALGLTELEAEVYTCLLQEAPVTGYRIAQLLGKPVANTYKAIQALEAKGAILVDEGANRLCRAIPPEELLSRLDRQFRQQREQAASALAALKPHPEDDRVYQLRSRDQVLERCRAMLARCTRIAIIDIFPLPLHELKADIECLAARGVRVALKAYEHTEVAGVDVAISGAHESVRRRWPGQWCNMVTDGREHLIAYLTPDGQGLHQAVWSGSAYLSWIYHSALTSEWLLAELENRTAKGESMEKLREMIIAFSSGIALDAPGYQDLMNRFVTPPVIEDRRQD